MDYWIHFGLIIILRIVVTLGYISVPKSFNLLGKTLPNRLFTQPPLFGAVFAEKQTFRALFELEFMGRRSTCRANHDTAKSRISDLVLLAKSRVDPFHAQSLKGSLNEPIRPGAWWTYTLVRYVMQNCGSLAWLQRPPWISWQTDVRTDTQKNVNNP